MKNSFDHRLKTAVLFVTPIILFVLTVSTVFAQDPAPASPASPPAAAGPAARPTEPLPESFNVQKYLDLDYNVKCEEYEGLNRNLWPRECQGREAGPDKQGAAYFKIAEAKGISPVAQVIVNVIDLLAKLIGSIALLIFIAGAVLTIVSEGQEDRMQKGKQAMIYSLIGIVIALSAYVIATFVQSFFY